MANLVLAFAELLGGAIIADAAIKGDSIANVVKGKATTHTVTGLTGGTPATAAAAGTAGAGSAITGAASALGTAPPGSSKGFAKVYSLAQALVGSPYNNLAGHSAAISETVAQVKKTGTDCSGYVSDLMGPQGLGIWQTALATPSIPTAPSMVSGQGSQITLWNNPNPGNSGHVWIQFNLPGGVKRYFEEGGAQGNAHEMTAAAAHAYLSTGAYKPFHPTGY